MRILVAVDGSRYSVDVVDGVLAHPWSPGSVFRILSVVEPEPIMVTSVQAGAGAVPRSQTQSTEELVGLIGSSLASHGLAVSTTVKPGDAREVIVNEAADWEADLIVIGAFGHSGVRNWEIGSVAKS